MQANHDDDTRTQLQKDFNEAYEIISFEDKESRRKIQQNNLLKIQKMKYESRKLTQSQVDEGEFVFIDGYTQETVRLVRTTVYDFPFLPKSHHA